MTPISPSTTSAGRRTNNSNTNASSIIKNNNSKGGRKRNHFTSDGMFYRLLVTGLTVCIMTTWWIHSELVLSSDNVDEQQQQQWTFLDELIFRLQTWSHPQSKFIPRRRRPLSSSSSSSTLVNDNNKNKNKNSQNKPLNILLLYADDWRFDSLGVAGNPFVHTPFLDSLAKERGIRFTHNCVTTSICWLSRATLHTGLYASQHRGWMPDEPFWYHQWYESFPHLMKESQDYAVAHCGKWDYSYFHQVQQIFETYQYSRIYQYQHWYTREEVEADVAAQTQITGQPRYDSKYQDYVHVHQDETHGNHQQERIHTTHRTVHDALEFLTHRPKDKPFMLTVSFFPPHAVDGTEEQFFPQPETAVYYSGSNNKTILPPVPPGHDVSSMNESWDRLPPSIFKEQGNEARKRWHDRFDNTTKYNTMMQNYYRLITGIDTASETLVSELERQNLLNDTLIIFTTDNGYYHGEHGLAGKWFPHQESIRIPLIIVDPRAPSSTRGTTKDEFTLNIDLAPTLLGAAQIPIPSQMQGRDLAQLYLDHYYQARTPTSIQKSRELNHNNHITNKQTPWREEFFYEHPQFWDGVFLPASTALVRKTHKYIQWGATLEDRVEQLFDLEKDPKEEVDVSHDPAYASILVEMKQRHEKLRQQCCIVKDEDGHEISTLVHASTS